MAVKKAHASRLSPSTLISVGLVVASGAIVWFGTRPDDRGAPVVSAPMAMAAAPSDSASDIPSMAGLGGLPTRLVVPTAGIDTLVSEVGIVSEEGKPAWQTAWRAAGHHMDSARPGQPGNMVLTGHVSVADRRNIPVFASLSTVKEGDIVEVQSGDQTYRYRVQSVSVVDASAVHLLKSSHASTVTLVTCTRDLKRRVVVVGILDSV